MNHSLHEKTEEIWCCLQLLATSKRQQKIVRQCVPNCQSSGFTCSGEESKSAPWGIICHELLSKEAFPASGAS